MNFKEFLCEWFDECYEIKDKRDFFVEEVDHKTVTKDL